MSVAQVAFGVATLAHYALRPGMISFPALRTNLLRETWVSKVVIFLDLPLGGCQTCIFQPWETDKVIYIMLSLVYGTFFLLFTVHPPTSNPVASAVLIILYSAKRQGGLTPVGGVPSLLEKVRQDATTYSPILSAGHPLFFPEVFAPVSNRPVDSCSGMLM